MKVPFFSFFLFLSFLFCLPVHGVQLREVMHVDTVPRGIECVLGVDIGGTNSDFGFFAVQNRRPELLFSLHARTKDVQDFNLIITHVLAHAKQQYGVFVKRCCIGAPGPRTEERDFSTGGELGLIIDAQRIKQDTGMEVVIILNDFELIGSGVDLLDPASIIEINKGRRSPRGPRVIVGAGTAVGAAFLAWDQQVGDYLSYRSELGSTVFAPLDEHELAFAQKYAPPGCKGMSWNYVLGGCGGIITMWNFLRERAKQQLLASGEIFTPGDIFDRYATDLLCTQVVDWYVRLYARFLQMTALAFDPFGGIYIAGGIAAKHVKLFQSDIFLDALFSGVGAVSWRKELLHDIPIYLITDYKVSLYGAANYALHAR